MESTGSRGRIQISQTTADLISDGGKAHWITPREDAVQAKGKGVMKTYWLNRTVAQKGSSSVASSEGETASPAVAAGIVSSPVTNSTKQERLVRWMVELLMEHLKKIVSDHRAVNFRSIYSFPASHLFSVIECQPWNRK
jgi:hypothetical protein